MPQSTDEVLGVMLACATGLVAVCGAFVVYSTRLVFLWQPRSLALALGAATGGMLFFTLVELLPEGQRAFQDVVTKLLHPHRDDDGIDTEKEHPLLEGYASLMLAGAFSLGATMVWVMDTLCLRYAEPTNKRRPSRDPTMLTRTAVSDVSSSNFGTQSTTRHTTTTAGGTTRRRGETLVLPSNASDLSTNELLYRTTKARVVAFALQNIPEGMVLCIATDQRRTLGVLFACAISILNVTQGMAFAGLLTQSSGLRWRAVLWCVLAALGLPLGGFFAWAVLLQTTLNTLTRGVFYGVTSGLLVTMCLSQTLTACYKYKRDGDGGHVTTTVLSGVVFMAALRMALAFLYV